MLLGFFSVVVYLGVGLDKNVGLGGIVGLGASVDIGIGGKPMMSYAKLDAYQCTIQFALECGATMDVGPILGLIEATKKTQSKDLLHRIVAMLTKLSGVSPL